MRPGRRWMGVTLNLLDGLSDWVGVLLERNSAIFPNRVAGKRTPRLRLTKTTRIYDGRIANCPNEWCVGVPDDENVGIDALNLLLPTLRLFRAIAEQWICGVK